VHLAIRIFTNTAHCNNRAGPPAPGGVADPGGVVAVELVGAAGDLCNRLQLSRMHALRLQFGTSHVAMISQSVVELRSNAKALNDCFLKVQFLSARQVVVAHTHLVLHSEVLSSCFESVRISVARIPVSRKVRCSHKVLFKFVFACLLESAMQQQFASGRAGVCKLQCMIGRRGCTVDRF
jgi:hypothetical protein